MSTDEPFTEASESSGRSAVPLTGVLLAVTGVVAIVGSVTPWANVAFAGETIDGIEGDGKLTVAFGAGLVLVGATLTVRRGRLGVVVVGLAFALFTLLVGLYDVGSINGTYGPLAGAAIPDDAVSIGFGLWLVVAAGAVAVVVAVTAVVTYVRRARDVRDGAAGT